MEDTIELLKNLGARNNGDIYLGVTGPVRTGKSTFIRKFMEVCVLEHIDDIELKKRSIDELPATGEGRIITTIEPKFVPSSAIELELEQMKVKIRLIDCVGYIIESSSGYLEDGKMRLIQTPWFNEPIPFDDAAKIGTNKVIKDHSTLGIVVLSDGSINEFKVEDFASAEKRVLEEMASLDKPYIIILNSKMPNGEIALRRKEELSSLDVPVIPVDVKNMTHDDCNLILKEALYQFPISGVELTLPSWVSSLDKDHYISKSLSDSIEEAMKEGRIVKDVDKINDVIKENEYVEACSITHVDTSSGICTCKVDVKDGLYEKVLNELMGCEINDKGQLIAVLSEYVRAKKDFDLIGNALNEAKETGYGFASSNLKEYVLTPPTLIKTGSRYGVKVKAKTSTYHIIKVDVETTFEPVLGGKEQADFFKDYLQKAYDEDPLKMLDCELFGRKYQDILIQGINLKLNSLPEPVKIKMQQLLKTIANKGRGNLIAFVF